MLLDKAYGIEVDLYEKYNELGMKADEIDKPTYSLILEMCGFQKESIADYLTKSDRLKLTNDMLIYEANNF